MAHRIAGRRDGQVDDVDAGCATPGVPGCDLGVGGCAPVRRGPVRGAAHFRQRIRVAGVTGATPVAGEGTAEVYVVIAHGVWHVDFAKARTGFEGSCSPRQIWCMTCASRTRSSARASPGAAMASSNSTAVRRSGSSRSTAPHVQRYYQSVRDEMLVYAIEDLYREATLVFGDAGEALFHDPTRGQLLRVPRGSCCRRAAYVIGADNKSAARDQAHRSAGRGHLVGLVEYTRKHPPYFTGAAAPDANEGMTIAYRRARKVELMALMGHARLSAPGGSRSQRTEQWRTAIS